MKTNWHFKKIYLVYVFACLFNISIWLWLWFYIRPVGNSLPLHYNIYFGIDEIGNGYELYFLPLLGLIIILFNLLLGSLIEQTNRLATRYLAWLSLVCQLGLGLALFLLIINYF